MIHSFDVDLAVKYGLDEAIFIENLKFWLNCNKADNRNFYKGKFWTYDTAKAYAIKFPYWNPMKVHRITKKLEECGVLQVDWFASNHYDRTKWYTFTDDFAKLQNVFCKNEKSSISTDINTDTKEDQCPHKEILSIWKEVLPEAPQVRGWTAARQKLLRNRWQEDEKRQNLEWWRKFFCYLSNSSFLMGKVATQNRKPFEVSLDWLLKEDNFVKCLEGKYHAKDEQ